MNSQTWMIYGANGYTGTLIADEAKRRGLNPVLAGRNAKACAALGERLGLESRVFSCGSPDEIEAQLRGLSLVLHCAGPFSKTSAPMLAACRRAGVHYLDITGEISVFEAILSQDQLLRDEGIVAMPGVGFDVVPTDCLAASLKEALPDAHQLRLGFRPSGAISPGSAQTMVEALGEGGAIRRDGKLVRVPAAYRVRQVAFQPQKPRLAMTIPWGDLSTAFRSTGIPNIEVYVPTTARNVRMMRLAYSARGLLRRSAVQNLLKSLAKRFMKGPSAVALSTRECLVWGEVSNEAGHVTVKRLRLPDAYAFTAISALAVVTRVLAGEVKPGAWTPSQAFGSWFVLEIEGVRVLEGA